MKKKVGRRKKATGPAFPYYEVDRLLVHGEAIENKKGKGASIVYPSYREIADRYEVSHGLIANYARSYNCLNRRKQATMKVNELAG